MNTSELIAKWKKQSNAPIRTKVFRNTTEANIFIGTLGENFISSVASRQGIVVTYYDC